MARIDSRISREGSWGEEIGQQPNVELRRLALETRAQLDVAIYYALVSLICVLKATIAFVQDFPGSVEKPSQVWYMDLAIAVADLIFVIVVTLKPVIFELWHAGTGITGFAGKLGRAYIIAAFTTPLNPILMTRDRFNAFAPAIVTAMNGVLTLMAVPSEKFPLGGAVKPSAPFVDCGEGLSNADRCKLRAVILSSMS